MTGDKPAGGEQLEPSSPQIDPDAPNPARIYNAWLGGKDNFLADRNVAEQVARAAPFVVAGARANRAFLRRAVTHLARSGVDQYLDLGAGLPSAGNVHEIAQQINPGARVAYVDHDPVVLAHARALLARDENTVAVGGDLRDPHAILTDPTIRRHLDFHRPIAVLMVAVLHFITPREDPAQIVATVRNALTSGSQVVISHVADLADRDVPPHVPQAEATRAAAAVYDALAVPFTLRTAVEIHALFAGFELAPPGLVRAQQWRPDRRRPANPIPVLAGVAQLL